MDFKEIAEQASSLLGEQVYNWLVLVILTISILLAGANKIFDFVVKWRNEKEDKKISKLLDNLEKTKGIDDKNFTAKDSTIAYLNDQLTTITANKKRKSSDEQGKQTGFIQKIKFSIGYFLLVAAFFSVSLLWAHALGYHAFLWFVALAEKIMSSFASNGLVEASPYALYFLLGLFGSIYSIVIPCILFSLGAIIYLLKLINVFLGSRVVRNFTIELTELTVIFIGVLFFIF